MGTSVIKSEPKKIKDKHDLINFPFPFPYAILNHQYCIQFANSPFKNLTGHEKNIQGRTIFELFTIAEQDEGAESFTSNRLQRKDGFFTPREYPDNLLLIQQLNSRSGTDAEDEKYIVVLLDKTVFESQAFSFQRHLDYLKLLNEITNNINQYNDIESLAEFIVNKVHNEKYNFYHVSIFLREKDLKGDYVYLVAIAGESKAYFDRNFKGGYRQSIEIGVVGKTIREKKPIFVKDLRQIDYYHHLPSFMSSSELCVPIFLQNEVVGVINIESKDEAEFDQADIAILQTVANLFAMSIQRIRITEKIRRRNKELEVYLESLQNSKKRLQEKTSSLVKKLESVEAARLVIERQNQTMLNELSMAEKLQKSLLPRKFPNIPGIRFASKYTTTSQLGGDFFDVVQLDDQTLGILIADVSGHGVSSAIIAAMVKAFFRNYQFQFRSPAQLLQKMNQDFCKILDTGDFISAFYMIVNIESLSATFANASQSFPMYLNGKEKKIFDLDSLGFFLGVLDSTIYEDRTMRLEPGDSILFFTDGIIEAKNRKLENYGRERLKDKFLKYIQLYSDESSLITRNIFDDIMEFSRPNQIADDMTLLLVQFLSG